MSLNYIFIELLVGFGLVFYWPILAIAFIPFLKSETSFILLEALWLYFLASLIVWLYTKFHKSSEKT